MQVPPELTAAVTHIGPVVAQYRQALQDKQQHVELKVRLGKRATGGMRWDTDIGSATFYAVHSLLDTYDGWLRKQVHVDSHEYLFAHGSMQVRTTVSLASHVAVTHVRKLSLASLDLKLVTQPFDLRVSVKTEIPVEGATLPPIVEPHTVRVKKCSSFWLEKWRFNLTQLWSGATRSEAELNQATGKCTYEIDVECVCPLSTLSTLSDDYVSLSMLLKVCSMLGGASLSMLPYTGN